MTELPPEAAKALDEAMTNLYQAARKYNVPLFAVSGYSATHYRACYLPGPDIEIGKILSAELQRNARIKDVLAKYY